MQVKAFDQTQTAQVLHLQNSFASILQFGFVEYTNSIRCALQKTVSISFLSDLILLGHSGGAEPYLVHAYRGELMQNTQDSSPVIIAGKPAFYLESKVDIIGNASYTLFYFYSSVISWGIQRTPILLYDVSHEIISKTVLGSISKISPSQPSEMYLSSFKISSICTSQPTNRVFPTIDTVAEGNVLINITGQQHLIRKIIVSFSKFNFDFGDLYFQFDNSNSSLKFSNCNLFRNAGNTALNAYSLAVANHGSLILEKLNFNGGKIEGNETLIYSTLPKLIQFTSLTITNVTLKKQGNTSRLLLSVIELESESNIIISDIHVKQNTAGIQAEAGIIFIHAIEDQDQIQNEYPSAQPIILIENSEIIQNTLAQILEASAYPIAVKIFPNDQFSSIAVLLTEQYANILVRSNGLESCTSYIVNLHNDVRTLSCALVILRAKDALGLLKEVPRSIFIEGSFIENDLRTDGLTIQFKGTNTQTFANMISFKPNIPTLFTISNNALFRANDGGLVTLNNLFLQRSNKIGSESAPIVIIKSEAVQQSNELQKNAPGKLVIERCILEGGNTAISDVWYDLGLTQTCNVGYYATIVADGQSVVQISGSTI
ncbi:MAG: hypothetical protein EZS28_002021 [Streblomastix strix]|uniref:Uncharacterized protein n=1 Tax=Streblomastix strix TaxID=222440 RepID=A0A5J4X5H5_9EUKA|nr:MAG: hypothetical protein EZS28_002021 [Streblomastix strix]